METELPAPRILLTGKDGQVGFALSRRLGSLENIIAIGRTECDFGQPEAIRALVAAVRPDIIINPAGYTAVDKAETEADLAYAINAVAPRVLAEEAAKHDALLIHYSTDYVFDGTKDGAYVEDDAPNPQSVYGQSKLAGENAIRAAGCRHLILRTSWVYGLHGQNFLKTILRLAGERETLRIVADQIGAPTSASLLAEVTVELVQHYLRDPEDASLGTYHVTAAGQTSWHGYAQFVLQMAQQRAWPLRVRASEVVPIATGDYPALAPRPANSRLITGKLSKTFGVNLPHWQPGVTEVLDQLIQS